MNTYFAAIGALDTEQWVAFERIDTFVVNDTSTIRLVKTLESGGDHGRVNEVARRAQSGR